MMWWAGAVESVVTVAEASKRWRHARPSARGDLRRRIVRPMRRKWWCRLTGHTWGYVWVGPYHVRRVCRHCDESQRVAGP